MGMSLEVLLRRNIEGVGTVGEVVRVKPGYARNYLFPMAYAAPVTADSLGRIAKDKVAEAARQTEMSKKRALLKEQLENLEVTLEARAGEDGHLYGSVGPRQVINHLAELGYKFEERHIIFENVRELGEYTVQLNLGAGVEVPIKLWVVQDAQDALAMKEAAEAAAQAEAEGSAEDEFVEDEFNV